MNHAGAGKDIVIGTGSHATSEVRGEPADEVVVELGVEEFFKEKVVRDGIKSFGEVDGSC